MTYNSQFKSFFTFAMTEWSKANLREFPWRYSDNIYEVLLSEYLLKKTNAEKVGPIYTQLITLFPTIQSLYSAETGMLEQILTPLGLKHQRTKLLKHMAAVVMEDYNGLIPTEYKELKMLPGVGEYTASATLCFTSNQRRPIVDVNVIRLFQRFFGYISEKKTISTDPIIWNLAFELLPESDCRKFNYALLDFPHLICKYHHPKCESCPLGANCTYYRGWVSIPNNI